MSVQKQLCLRRLAKEYVELRSCPVAGCSAAPLEENLLEWHANITTPRFQGIAFHFVLKFPDNYPKMPPKVVPQHYIKHQNVFGDYICLDILTMAAELETSPYRGWSNAYTVSSLLVQLQAFLFDVERVEDEEGAGSASYHNDYGINRMYREARQFKCTKCPHWGHKPFPELDESANLNQPGFYKTLRPAIVRAGVELETPKVCEIASNNIVKVVKFAQHRACVALDEGVKGWCSKVTKNGVLLKRVFTAGPGVYKVNRKSEVAVGEDIVGNLPRRKYVDVLKVFVMGDRLCGVVDLKHPSVVLKDKQCPYQYGEVYLVNLRFHEKFPSEEEEEDINDDGSRFFVDDPNILDTLFLFCDPDTLHRICQVNPYFEKRMDRMKVLNEMNNRCYYTLKSMAEENTVLGVGLASTIMDKRSRATGRKRPVLQQLHPTFDLLSAEAFYKHNCRTTIYKDCNFDSFLPLYINEAHGKRALPAARKAIHDLWKKENKNHRMGSKSVLNTLVKLMNTTVIDMMKTVMDLNVAEIQLYDSIKALEGYMGFHHLLLAFAEQDPRIVTLAEDRVGNFLKNAACRDKEVTPDIGELIVCLALSNYSWEEFIPKYIDEAFQRNSRWILSEYPNLRNLEPMGTISCIRMRQSYENCKTGFRMAMFQRYFMKEIASPQLLEGDPDKLKILFKEYNDRFGKPIAGAAEALQRHSRKVLACDNFFDFFELIGFCAPSAVGLCDWLRSSIKRSEKREYHSTRNVLRYTEKHKVEPTYDLHLNANNCSCCGGKVFQLNSNGKPHLISEKKTQLDLAFVVDCTGSMTSWLDAAKKQMHHIVQEISAKTQFKKVRFAVVGYRDFGYEKGDWREPTLVKPFTDNVRKVQNYVTALRTGGGGNKEALSAGLAKAAELTWNEKAMQIIIHIGDQLPHGMDDGYDTYPDGDPDGSDALRTAHVLAKQGCVIYNVDCSSSYSYSYYNTSDSALRTTFYHALAMITNGTCVNITDAGALAQIVLGAALEEQAQNKLAKLILPLYQEVIRRHEIGRFEQHVHQIYHLLKAQKVKVHTSMGVTKYPEHALHQIENLTYCTDLKQAKAMAKSEYFMDFKPTVNFSAEHKALVTEGQVRKCLLRIKDKAQEIMFHKQGCSFRTERWQPEAFAERWMQYQKTGARKVLKQPWQVVRKDELSNLRRVLQEAGKIASGEIKLKSSAGPARGRKTYVKPKMKSAATPNFKWGQKQPVGQRQQGQKRPSPNVPQGGLKQGKQQKTQQNAWGQRRAPVQRPVSQQQAPVQQPVSQQQAPVQRPVSQQQAPRRPRQQQPIPQASVPQQQVQRPVSQQAPGRPRQQAPAQQHPAPRQQPIPQAPVRQRQQQAPTRQSKSPAYVAPHRRSNSITRTSTYMGAHGPQSIRGSRSQSRDASRSQQQQQTRRSTSRDSHRRPQRPVTRERPMSAQPMGRNQSIPINSHSQSVYQNQPVAAPVVPVNTSCSVLITNLPPTVSKAQFTMLLQQNRIPPPVAMGKDRQQNLVWCTFSHPQYSGYLLNAKLWIQGMKLNVIRPSNAI